MVDDDEATRFIVRRALVRMGARVSEAEGVESAILFLESNLVDVILSDYRMPGKNGVDLLCHAKEAHPGTRRVLMSGTLSEDLLRLHVRGACADFLFEKPMSREAWDHVLGVALRAEAPAPYGEEP